MIIASLVLLLATTSAPLAETRNALPAPSEMGFDATDPAALAAAVQAAGYKAELKTGEDGDPYITSAANGQPFTLEFYDCKDGKCNSFQFSSWWKPDPLWTATLTNEWNANKRFLRIGIDKQGRLREYLDVTGVGRMTQAQLADWIDWYQSMDVELSKFIDSHRPTPPAATKKETTSS